METHEHTPCDGTHAGIGRHHADGAATLAATDALARAAAEVGETGGLDWNNPWGCNVTVDGAAQADLHVLGAAIAR